MTEIFPVHRSQCCMVHETPLWFTLDIFLLTSRMRWSFYVGVGVFMLVTWECWSHPRYTYAKLRILERIARIRIKNKILYESTQLDPERKQTYGYSTSWAVSGIENPNAAHVSVWTRLRSTLLHVLCTVRLSIKEVKYVLVIIFKKSINQSINQATSQSVNQPTWGFCLWLIGWKTNTSSKTVEKLN